jgi:hypothetical protein
MISESLNFQIDLFKNRGEGSFFNPRRLLNDSWFGVGCIYYLLFLALIVVEILF